MGVATPKGDVEFGRTNGSVEFGINDADDMGMMSEERRTRRTRASLAMESKCSLLGHNDFGLFGTAGTCGRRRKKIQRLLLLTDDAW